MHTNIYLDLSAWTAIFHQRINHFALQPLYLYTHTLHTPSHVFTTLHAMQTRSSDENSVRLSVRLSVKLVICDKMEETWVQIFISYERSFSLVFWEEEWLVRGDPFYPKFWVNRPPLKQNRWFWPIFTRSSSAVTPSEKSSINTNRKSSTRFPLSLRLSSYVAPKSPKGGRKNAKRPISVQNRTSLEESLLQSFFVWNHQLERTRCSAIAERPRCRVRYSFRQK